MINTRREFLLAMGLAALADQAAVGQQAADQSVEGALMPPDPPRSLTPNRANLGTLLDDVQTLAEQASFAGSFLTSRFATLEEFKTQMRAKLLELLLYRPEKVDPRPELLERRDMGDYIRERIVFSTSPQFRVPAYVLVPKGARLPAPAIVDLHSHGGMFLFGKEKVIDLGQNHPTMVGYHQRNYDGRPTATALVRRGYVVVSIDALMFGERRIQLDADLPIGWDRSRISPEQIQQLNQVCRAKESTIVKGLTLAGLTWPGIVLWDDMRTVDYLLTRHDVDPKRIGCLGISMGGYRAAYLAGLDERIAAACVVGFMSSVRPMIRSHLDTHSFVHFLPGLHQWLDLPDVASLMAPKPLLVQQCRQDGLFPLSGMQESVEKIDAVYRRASAAERFSGRFYDVPHRFTLAMQDDAFNWLDRWL
jgi:dienelactone hydrolase